jgi:hypothetical protein
METPRPSPGAPQAGAYSGYIRYAGAAAPYEAVTSLALHAPPEFGYQLQQVVVGEGGKRTMTVVAQGQYFILRGNADDPDATVFELVRPDGPLYFQRISDDELRLLDKDHKPIEGSANLSLKRVK